MTTIIYMSKMNEKDSANMQTCVKIKKNKKNGLPILFGRHKTQTQI